MKKWTQKDFEGMRKDWNNSTLVGWKLWYTDGSFITSNDIKFDEAPQAGVQALIKYYKRSKGGYSREIQTGLDMYVLYSEQPLDLELPPQIKKGENLSDEDWTKFNKMVRDDKDMVESMKK